MPIQLPRKIPERLFTAASIQRWNDHVRPIELTELDKQAHKAMIAYLLARFEEQQGQTVQWQALIETMLFQFLPRLVLTDIKAPLFERLMQVRGEQINRHVLDSVGQELADYDHALFTRFEQHMQPGQMETRERRLANAAHYLSTKWEFEIVYRASEFMYGIETTRAQIDNQMQTFLDLHGVREIQQRKAAYGFVDLCGQLRFQQRWAQVPRVPRTSVLGHSLFVASVCYLLEIKLGGCARRQTNAFFAALFHDLPEVFTRDIISPVKYSIEGLNRCIEEEERELVRERLLPLLPSAWHEDIRYYVEDPFLNRIRIDGHVSFVSLQELDSSYNNDRFDPVPGEIIRACDELAAFFEAVKSIENGIRPPALIAAAQGFLRANGTQRTGPVDWPALYAEFNIEQLRR